MCHKVLFGRKCATIDVYLSFMAIINAIKYWGKGEKWGAPL
jgi:hypothetical protein